MTDRSEETVGHDLLVVLLTLVGGIIGIAAGWDAVMYHGQFLASGIGAFAVALAGDVEAGKQVYEATMRQPPTTFETVMLFAGCGLIILNTIMIHTGVGLDD